MSITIDTRERQKRDKDGNLFYVWDPIIDLYNSLHPKKAISWEYKKLGNKQYNCGDVLVGDWVNGHAFEVKTYPDLYGSWVKKNVNSHVPRLLEQCWKMDDVFRKPHLAVIGDWTADVKKLALHVSFKRKMRKWPLIDRFPQNRAIIEFLYYLQKIVQIEGIWQSALAEVTCNYRLDIMMFPNRMMFVRYIAKLAAKVRKRHSKWKNIPVNEVQKKFTDQVEKYISKGAGNWRDTIDHMKKKLEE